MSSNSAMLLERAANGKNQNPMKKCCRRHNIDRDKEKLWNESH